MHRRFALAAVAALTLAGAAQAQTRGAAADGGRSKFGVGIGVNANAVVDVATVLTERQVPTMVYFPIVLSQQFRVEPQLGIATYSTEGASGSVFAIGAGFFLTQPIAQATDLYVGPRLVLGFTGAERTNNFGVKLSGSAVDVTIAAAIGAEYLVSPHFSVGAEAQLGYTNRPDITDQGATIVPKISGVATEGIVFLRAYL